MHDGPAGGFRERQAAGHATDLVQFSVGMSGGVTDAAEDSVRGDRQPQRRLTGITAMLTIRQSGNPATRGSSRAVSTSMSEPAAGRSSMPQAHPAASSDAIRREPPGESGDSETPGGSDSRC